MIQGDGGNNNQTVVVNSSYLSLSNLTIQNGYLMEVE